MTTNYYTKKWVKRLLEYTPVHEPACVVETAYVELEDFSGAPIKQFIVYPDRLGWDEVRHDSLVTRFSPGYRCFPGCEPEAFDTEAYAKEWLKETKDAFNLRVFEVKVDYDGDEIDARIKPIKQRFLTVADMYDYVNANEDTYIVAPRCKYITVDIEKFNQSIYGSVTPVNFVKGFTIVRSFPI